MASTAFSNSSLLTPLTSSHSSLSHHNSLQSRISFVVARSQPLSIQSNKKKNNNNCRRSFAVNCSVNDDAAAESNEESVPIELRYKAYPTVMDINQIREILPHRYPFLLVDRVIEYNPGVSAVAIKNVTINDNFFPGHFPERPIMPGVLMVEAMAQVGGLVMLQPEVGGSRENFFFAGIDKVRFRKPVIAGDTLVMRMTLTKLQKRFGIAKMEGKAYVGGEVVCEGEFLMAMDRSDGSVVFQFGKACETQDKAGLEATTETETGGVISVEGIIHEEEVNALTYRDFESEGTSIILIDNTENMGIRTQIDEVSVSIEDTGVAKTACDVIEAGYKNMVCKQPVQDTVSSEDNDITETARSVIEPEHKSALNKEPVEDNFVDTKESEYIGLDDVSSILNSNTCERNLEMLGFVNEDNSMAKSEAENGSEAPLDSVSSVDVPTSNVMEIIIGDENNIETMNPSLASEYCGSDGETISMSGKDNDVDDLGKVISLSSLVNAEVDYNEIEEPDEAVENESFITMNESTHTVNSEIENLKGDSRDISKPSLVELEPSKSSPQREQVSSPGLVLFSGATSLPHPSKGGKDAYLVAGQYWFGVADGIGLWSLEGCNTGLYAQELMENCEKIVSCYNEVSITSSREALTFSAAEARSPGLSTVLVAHFDGQVLDVANIGDCGFAIIRHGIVFERSSAMFHELHFPLQIEKGDDPSRLVEEYLIDLDDGDVFVIATDGLFDNLYEQEIASIVTKSQEANLKPEEIAKLLAMRAQDVGRSASARSPFADTAQAAGYVGFTGGKLDDVTVIVSLVQNGPVKLSPGL